MAKKIDAKTGLSRVINHFRAGGSVDELPDNLRPFYSKDTARLIAEHKVAGTLDTLGKAGSLVSGGVSSLGTAPAPAPAPAPATLTAAATNPNVAAMEAAKAETAARNQLSAQQAALARHKAEAAVASEVPQARAGLRGGVDLNVGGGATINKAAPIDFDVGGGKTRGVINPNPVTMGEKFHEGLRSAGQSVANRMPALPNPNITREGIKAAATKAGNVGMRGLGAVGGLMSARAALNADNWGDRVYHGVDAVAGGLTAFKPTMLAGMALGLGNQVVHGLAGGFNEGPVNGTVDPKEVARQIAEHKAAQVPTQSPVTEALPERTLEQVMAGRANNMNRLQGEVLRAKDTLSDAQANTMALAPLGGQASAIDAIINPMRMAAHTQQERAGLQRAMGEYGMAGKAQAHDDTTGLRNEEITMQHALAMARLKADQTQRAQERIDKAVPFTVENPKTGMQEPDQAGAAMYRRNADSLGLAAVTDPAKASQVANKVMLNTTMARNAGANDPYAGTSDGDIQFANTPNNGLRTASIGDWFQRGDGVTLGDIAMNRKVYGLKSAQGTRMHSSRSLANGDQSVMTYADQLAEAARAKSGGK